MYVAGFPAGPWAANCYVVAPAEGAECVIVDPGMDAVGGIVERVTGARLSPVAVLLTHGHLDHIWSAMGVCADYGIPAYIHPADRHLLSNPIAGVSGETRRLFDRFAQGEIEFVEPEAVVELGDGVDLDLAGLKVSVDHAPGHTPGTVALRIPAGDGEPDLMFTGDFLFAGSIGRTDLPGGDTSQMMSSLARVLTSMDDETVVLPGHGGATTVGRERRTNPFLAHLGTPPGAARSPGRDRNG